MHQPFDGFDVGHWAAPAFGDVDGDGDLDAIVGAFHGTLRYFRNDRGESVAERGIERVKAGAKGRAALSTVAVIGMCNLLTLVYYVPLYYVAIHSEDWPADITSRSYFGVCGPQTDYACPGDRVPIVRGPDSAHARPDGTMVAPAAFIIWKPRSSARL